MIRTINFFVVEGVAPSVAVDLGCGSGPDTLELLRQGWRVHAVDAEAWGLKALRETTPPELAAGLHTHTCRFESFEFPPCDLVWAGFVLPFCPRAAWSTLVNRIVRALNPGGRFAGDLSGDKHAWSGEEDVLTFTEGQAQQALQELVVDAFDIEDEYRVSGGKVTRWHAFGRAARKAVAAMSGCGRPHDERCICPDRAPALGRTGNVNRGEDRQPMPWHDPTDFCLRAGNMSPNGRDASSYRPPVECGVPFAAVSDTDFVRAATRC